MGDTSRHKKLGNLELTGAMASRVMPSGKRAIKLRKDERRELIKQQKVETAVALFLDLNADHSWEEIAEKCGLSLIGLKDLTKTEEFMQVYNAHFAELGHDPRLKATQAALTDLLSPAIRAIREILVSPTAPASAKAKAAFEIIRLNGLEALDPKGTDKTELHEFLRKSGVNIEQMNITLPPEYLEKGVAEIVEGQVREISSKPLVLIENSAEN
ncbi:MAG: hypothetical protein AAGU17_00575 [Anaerolineaceae bacterium]